MADRTQHWIKTAQDLWDEYKACAESLKAATADVSGINSPLYCVQDDRLDRAEISLGQIEGCAYRMRMILSQLSTYPIQFRYPVHDIETVSVASAIALSQGGGA